MKAIGFANTYFTLWDITHEDVYVTVNGQHRLSGKKTNYRYIQNLSVVESIAKSKFTKITKLPFPEPDIELRGKSSSFSNLKQIDIYAPNEFRFGKYQYKTFEEVNDLSYLFWYANKTFSTEAIKICEDSGKYKYHDDQLITVEQYNYYAGNELILQKILSKENHDIMILKNISGSGSELCTVTVKFLEYNTDWTLTLNQHRIPVKWMQYHGAEYGLFKDSKGKGKKLKGKIVNVDVRMIKDSYWGDILMIDKINI